MQAGVWPCSYILWLQVASKKFLEKMFENLSKTQWRHCLSGLSINSKFVELYQAFCLLRERSILYKKFIQLASEVDELCISCLIKLHKTWYRSNTCAGVNQWTQYFYSIHDMLSIKLWCIFPPSAHKVIEIQSFVTNVWKSPGKIRPYNKSTSRKFSRKLLWLSANWITFFLWQCSNLDIKYLKFFFTN